MSELIKKFKKINMEDTRVRVIVIAAFILFSRLVTYLMFGLLNGDFSFDAFIYGMNRFDSDHYMRIISEGYIGPINLMGEAEWAFFPMYPLLMKALCTLTGVSPYVMAFVMGNIFLLLSVFFAMKYMEISKMTVRAQYIYAFMLTFGCYSFYFNLLYTEGLFLLLLVLSFYFLEKKQYAACGITGLLMSFSRNLGIFFVFVMAIRWVMFYFEEKGNPEKKMAGESVAPSKNSGFGTYFLESLKNPGLVLGVSLVPAGMFAYMLYLNSLVGDGLAFVSVQYGWRRVNSFFLKNLINGLKEIDSLAAYLAVWAVAGFWLLAVCFFKEKRYHEVIWGLMALVIPMQSALDSIPRYMLGAFVFYRILAGIMGELKWYNKMIALALFAGYELVLINGWIYGAGVLS